LAALDHWLADGVLALTGWDPGLLITGTAFALGLAYLVRFFGIAQGAVDAAYRPGLAVAVDGGAVAWAVCIGYAGLGLSAA
jgi:hypothetical protein